MDIARGVLVERHRLEQDKLGVFGGLLDVNQFVEHVLPFEDVGVALLADFAFKLLPVVAGHVLTVLLRVALGAQPALEAVEVDQAHRAATLAGQDQGVVVVLLGAPAEPALDRVLGRSKQQQWI